MYANPVPERYTETSFTITMTVAIKNNNNMPLVVPRAIRRKAGFKSGQELEIKASGGVITILPRFPSADDEYTPAERRAIDRGIAQSEKEYREGKHVGPFTTAEEFLADLHRESAKLDTKRKHSRK
jgi:bifunctional DNA-binding transcriptional regulator/antitoxin component of YhaV-PrlF toxin-antitoxin module